jgi:hypothetical protein
MNQRRELADLLTRAFLRPELPDQRDNVTDQQEGIPVGRVRGIRGE